uniref:Uncharacterized protein n=1 Tax=Candidatus Kentrum sp. FW TaxID=2126338 RepID=A0A450RTF0_9GAMM|nr:MAG: hypothetical protein BECKFW1821A_GA0114235_1001138 [Candidatus Kentron sp. FW]
MQLFHADLAQPFHQQDDAVAGSPTIGLELNAYSRINGKARLDPDKQRFLVHDFSVQGRPAIVAEQDAQDILFARGVTCRLG